MISGEAIGWLCTITAVLCFGNYAVPTKFVPTGDGWVFQWIECVGILLVGLICEFISNSSPGGLYLDPIGMIGGMMWCLGNVTVIPVVDSIGLGMGMLIWGGTSMLVGWGTSFFGVTFGDTVLVQKEQPSGQALIFNVIGVALMVISIFMFFPVKPTLSKKTEEDPENEALLGNYNEESLNNDTRSDEKSGFFKKFLGIGLSVLAGLLYGLNIKPVTYLQNKNPGYKSDHPLAFTLSHFAGIFFTSTALLIGYCIYKKNKPQFYPQSILPALLAGVGWGIAQACWFVADTKLSSVTTFPVISTSPGLISALWGVAVFKEIQGKRNFLFLGLATTLTLSGIGFIFASKLVGKSD
eukprot:TRINITY_DN12612_c0_g1_i1.p1 TRINITY_DN12612_c0_g1~~TRINITY_DN12612_c0_g1_i1.p1  ORF type:complete len:353 (+),score=120.54 TRINITY_DN12612_c0_g1_i1:141-1199(+)